MSLKGLRFTRGKNLLSVFTPQYILNLIKSQIYLFIKAVNNRIYLKVS